MSPKTNINTQSKIRLDFPVTIIHNLHMTTIKFIILILITSTISCTMPAKKIRQMTGQFEIQNFSEVSFFDESTMNSEEILYKKYKGPVNKFNWCPVVIVKVFGSFND